MQSSTYYHTLMPSPIGPLRLVASDKGLCALLFNAEAPRSVPGELVESDAHVFLQAAQKQLAEYFAGARRSFDLKLDMRGSVFQINAWRELQRIPYGETISYGEQARRAGDVRKARAMGMANGRNPLGIVVPCHRVIGANGSLTGFGGGIKAKQWLLDMEARSLNITAPELRAKRG